MGSHCLGAIVCGSSPDHCADVMIACVGWIPWRRANIVSDRACMGRKLIGKGREEGVKRERKKERKRGRVTCLLRERAERRQVDRLLLWAQKFLLLEVASCQAFGQSHMKSNRCSYQGFRVINFVLHRERTFPGERKPLSGVYQVWPIIQQNIMFHDVSLPYGTCSKSDVYSALTDCHVEIEPRSPELGTLRQPSP